MEIIQTNITCVLIKEPKVFKEYRGYFIERLSKREFDKKVTPILGHSILFVQDNESTEIKYLKGKQNARPSHV